MKVNILVTGGLGYIGSHTVVELINSGFQPIIVDNLSNSKIEVLTKLHKLVQQDIKFYQQDYRQNTVLSQIINREHISGIIHFAAYKSVGESVHQPLRYYDNNVAGFVTLLKVCQRLPAIKNIVFSSSCTVYGEPDVLPVTETSQFKTASSPYGSTKQICDTILHDTTITSPTFNALSLRYFNPIGAHQSALIGELPIGTPANLIPFITQTAAGIRDRLVVYGGDYPTEDGSCVRDYIHVVDLAKAHVKALIWLQNHQPSVVEAVNIGTGKGTSVLKVIKTFETATGQKLNYEMGPRRDGDLISTYAETSKAHKLLNWRAEKDLETALMDAWRWQLNLSGSC